MSIARNSTLDVLRAFAIILVVNCHAASAYITLTSTARNEAPMLRTLQLGGHGVDLFFVLSGWLLGSILCREFKEQGTIDVRRFWYRRWLRTLPAYYAVLLLTYSQAALTHQSLDWSFLIFLQNYNSPLPYFSVSWSLCVEEHFYLLIAPVLLFVLPRWKTGLLALLAMVSLPIAFRWLGWFETLENTHVRADQCSAGVLLAYVSNFMPRAWARIQQVLPLLMAIGIGLITVNILRRVLGGPDLPLSAFTFIFATWVLWSQRNDFWSRRFGGPISRFVANRAYSIYLLHVEAIAVLKYAPSMPFWLYLVCVWFISLGMAELLYRAVELPGMRCREYFVGSKSATDRV